MTANGIILKGEKIVLPSNLQDTAIRLAHRGAHPGQSGLERRLRYHFFFHNMSKKIEEFVKSCNHCSMFIDKKTKEPIKPHRVPEKCWDTVSVDLFGPMPTSKHVVVVQDLASRFPAAKLVTSTKADKVLPALSEIYATYRNPEVQISDNGPPFNSAQMHDFATSKSIKLQKAPPLHPSSNPVETFMRPLGKAMKIAYQTRAPEKETLERTLNNYRHTPHPATGIPPAAMLFRDGQRYDFPRTYATEEDVCVRNYQKSRKFDPVFLGEPFKIIDMNDEGNKLIVEHQENGFSLCRHPDDVKPFIEPNYIEVEDVQWPVGDEGDMAEDLGIEKSGETAPTLRRSERKKTPNPRYI
ncbi:Transposon Tf2-9 poly [Paramuricea clavata]|uniref:Transposon Tf2-9 poly n=1 Tax=Paramuricea clavata TaxID=317549 RepID=A0A6S7KEF8_PARCT|nr:Transposon Tf2-9 poly [Paramuricea clavata]